MVIPPNVPVCAQTYEKRRRSVGAPRAPSFSPRPPILQVGYVRAGSLPGIVRARQCLDKIFYCNDLRFPHHESGPAPRFSPSPRHFPDLGFPKRAPPPRSARPQSTRTMEGDTRQGLAGLNVRPTLASPHRRYPLRPLAVRRTSPRLAPLHVPRSPCARPSSPSPRAAKAAGAVPGGRELHPPDATRNALTGEPGDDAEPQSRRPCDPFPRSAKYATSPSATPCA